MSYSRIEEPCDFEVRTDGDDTNGGGFAAPASSYSTGTDRSQQASAYVATGSGGVTATTMAGSGSLYRRSVVLSGHIVASADVGNLVSLTCSDSDVFDGLYMIKAVDTSTNTWEFISENRNSTTALNASGVSVTFKMGGAFASPGMVGYLQDFWINDKFILDVWVKSGTYTLSSTSSNVSGGWLSVLGGSQMKIEGYETTRGDSRSGGARPVIAAGSSGHTGTMLTVNTGSLFAVEIDGGGTATDGVTLGNYNSLAAYCKVSNLGAWGEGFTNYGTAVCCEATGCHKGFTSRFSAMNCVAHDCTYGFDQPRQYLRKCLAYDCTEGFYLTESGAINCAADDCGTAGFTSSDYTRIVSSVATNCGTGFNLSAARGTVLWECGAYNNTANYPSSTSIAVEGFIALGSDPWEDQSARDYRLNSETDGGELLKGKGLGFPGQTADSDINAFVTASSGGSTTVVTPGPVQIGM